MRIFSIGRVASPVKEATRVIPVASAAEPEVFRITGTPTKGTYPDPESVHLATGEAVYKIQRLQDMATIWKGTVLEPHTVMLLSMLLQEDGTITAERRHDCSKGVCYAIGLQGHNICRRGTPLLYVETGDPQKYFCAWKDGISPQRQFEKAYPEFATNWYVQFEEYTLRMTECIKGGSSENQCIQNWNPNESGRIGKVKEHRTFVLAALGW